MIPIPEGIRRLIGETFAEDEAARYRREMDARLKAAQNTPMVTLGPDVPLPDKPLKRPDWMRNRGYDTPDREQPSTPAEAYVPQPGEPLYQRFEKDRMASDLGPSPRLTPADIEGDPIPSIYNTLGSGGPEKGGPLNDADIIELKKAREERAAGKVRSSLVEAPAPPDQVAKDLELADELGVNRGLVETNRKSYEFSKTARDLDRLGSTAPKLRTWLDTARENLEVAHDDVQNLSWWEQIQKDGLSPGSFTFDEAGAAIRSGAVDTGKQQFFGAAEMGIGIARMFQGIPGVKPLLDAGEIEARKQRQIAVLDAMRNMPKGDTWLERGLYGAFQSAPASVEAMVATLITKSPVVGAASMGVGTGGQAFGEAEDAGKGYWDAFRYALEQGTIETATEMVPLKFLIGDLAKDAPLGKIFFHNALSEGIGEQAATFLQDASTWLELHPDKTVSEFFAERPNAALETLVASTLMTGVQTTVAAGLQKTGVMLDEQARQARAEKLAKTFDAMSTGAADSKLLKRLPEKYREAVANVTKDGPLENVRVTPEAFTELAQSAQVSTDQLAQAFRIDPNDLNAAIVSGNDVLIRSADYATGLATAKKEIGVSGDTIHSAFAPNMRLRADDFTAKERAAMQAVFEQEQEARSQAGTKDQAFADAADRVRETIREQVVATKLFNTEAANTQAEALGAMVETLAERTGMDPEALWKTHGFDIVAAVAGGEDPVNELAQSFVREPMPVTDAELMKASEALQPREFAAWKLARNGLSNEQIAEEMNKVEPDAVVSPAAVAGYLTSARAKEFDSPLAKEPSNPKGRPKNETTQRVIEMLAAGKSRDEIVTEVYPDRDKGKALNLIRQLNHKHQADIQKLREPANALELAQPKRGTFTPLSTRSVVRLFEQKNLSTLMHEASHWYLDTLWRMYMGGDTRNGAFNDAEKQGLQAILDGREVQSGDFAHPFVKEQIAAILEWQGKSPNWTAMFNPDGSFTAEGVEIQEAFAESFEAYLREGKAPTTALRSVFASFKAWLVRIYKSVRQIGNRVQLNDEIRAVFDRMLATDEAIAAATSSTVRDSNALAQALLDKGVITEKQVEKTVARLAAARERAEAELMARLMEDYERSQKAWWNDEFRQTQREVQSEVDERPEQRAYAWLSGKGWRDTRADHAEAALAEADARTALEQYDEVLQFSRYYEPDATDENLKQLYSRMRSEGVEPVIMLFRTPGGRVIAFQGSAAGYSHDLGREIMGLGDLRLQHGIYDPRKGLAGMGELDWYATSGTQDALPKEASAELAQFAPKNAQGAPLHSLLKATLMDIGGESKEDIWRETGWAQTRYGDWVWEIPGKPQFNFNPEKQAQSGRLDQLIEWPELFDAMPLMRDVYLKASVGRTAGRFESAAPVRFPSGEERVVTLITASGPVTGGNTLMEVIQHEIQHVIQVFGGFASTGAGNAVEIYRGTAAFDAEVKRLRDMERVTEASMGTSGAILFEPMTDAEIERIAALNLYLHNHGEWQARQVEWRSRMPAEWRWANPPGTPVPGTQETVDERKTWASLDDLRAAASGDRRRADRAGEVSLDASADATGTPAAALAGAALHADHEGAGTTDQLAQSVKPADGIRRVLHYLDLNPNAAQSVGAFELGRLAGATPRQVDRARSQWRAEREAANSKGPPSQAAAAWAAIESIEDRKRERAGMAAATNPYAPFDGATSLGQDVAPSRQLDALGFYSALREAVANSKQAKASAEQWKATLKNTPGVKQEEIEWTGLFDWLDAATGAIARADVVGFLDSNGVKVEEIRKRDAAMSEAETQRLVDQLVSIEDEIGVLREGGDPSTRGRIRELQVEQAKIQAELDGGSTTRFGTWTLPGGVDYTELVLTLPNIPGPATHWNESNVVAHVRFKTRYDNAGKRVLAIEEVQSDWHQKGREQGYAQPVDPVVVAMAQREADQAYADLAKANVALFNYFLNMTKADIRTVVGVAFGMQEPLIDLDKMASDIAKTKTLARLTAEYANQLRADVPTILAYQANPLITDGEFERRRGLKALLDERAAAELQYNEANQAASNAKRSDGIPRGPFANNGWAALVLKRMIRWAAERGFSEVAWTPGEVQADRYNLSKFVNTLEYNPDSETLVAFDEAGHGVIDRKVPRAELPNVIGNDLADQLLASDKIARGGGRQAHRLEITSQQVGGNGMPAFYDRILVNEANKLGKKYGSVVGRTGIRTGEYSDLSQWRVIGNQGQSLGSYATEESARIIASQWTGAKVEPVEQGFHSLPLTADLKAAALEGFPLFHGGDGSTDRTAPPPDLPPMRLNLQAVKDEYGEKALAEIPPEVAAFSAQANDVDQFVQLIKDVRRTLKQKRPKQLWKFLSTQRRIGQGNDKIAYVGIRDDGGELLKIIGEKKAAPGLISDKEDGKRVRSYTIEHAANVAWEMGYFSTESPPTPAEFLDALRLDFDGQAPLYARNDMDTLQQIQAAEKWEEWFDLNGIDMAEKDQAVLRAKLETALTGRGEGSIGPNEAAPFFKMPDGKALLDGLKQGPKRAQIIREETNRRMRERHGDIFRDGTIMREAETFARNEIQARQFEIELDALSRATGQQAASNLAKSQAIENLRTKQVREVLNYNQWLTLEQRWGKKALQAAEKGDLAKAAEYKRYQLVNMHMFREGRKLAEDIEKSRKHLLDYGKKTKQARLFAAGKDYADQMNGLLDDFQFRNETRKAEDKRAARGAWIAAQMASIDPYAAYQDTTKSAAEQQVAAAEALEKSSLLERLSEGVDTQNYKSLTVEDLMAVRAEADMIWKLATLKDRLIKEGERRRLTLAAEDIAAEIEANQPKPLPAEPIESDAPGEKAKRGARKYLAMHRQLQSLALQFSGGKDGGVFWRHIVRPLNEAFSRLAGMRVKMGTEIKALFGAYSEAEQKRFWKDRQTFNLSTGPVALTTQGRLAVALNWGNEKNRKRLMDSMGWSAQDVQTILDTLEKRDWDFIQATWDYLDTYFPEANRVHEAVHGAPMDKVEPLRVATAFGVYNGGYYPIAFDPNLSSKSAQRQTTAEVQSIAGRVGVRNQPGFSNKRVEGKVTLPLKLSVFDVITRHLDQVATSIATEETMFDVGRLVTHPEVERAIIERHGRQIYNVIVNILVTTKFGMEGTSGIIAHLRNGATVVGLGWKVATALLQPVGVTNSIVRVGGYWIAKGYARMGKDAATIQSSARWIMERSEFMRHRRQSQSPELAALQDRMKKNGVTPRWVTGSMFALMSNVQFYSVDMPTWYGGYYKAKAAGKDEGDAIAEADQCVIDAQGGGELHQTAAIQSGAGTKYASALRLLTNFMSYMITTYGLAVQRARNANSTMKVAALSLDMVLLLAVPVAAKMALDAWTKGGGGDDDDDLLEKYLREQAAFLMSPFVGFSQVAQAFRGEDAFSYRGPAGLGIFGEVTNAGKAAAELDFDESFWRPANRAAGMVFHYPASQLDATVRGANALWNGETQDPSVLFFGPPRN